MDTGPRRDGVLRALQSKHHVTWCSLGVTECVCVWGGGPLQPPQAPAGGRTCSWRELARLAGESRDLEEASCGAGVQQQGRVGVQQQGRGGVRSSLCVGTAAHALGCACSSGRRQQAGVWASAAGRRAGWGPAPNSAPLLVGMGSALHSAPPPTPPHPTLILPAHLCREQRHALGGPAGATSELARGGPSRGLDWVHRLPLLLLLLLPLPLQPAQKTAGLRGWQQKQGPPSTSLQPPQLGPQRGRGRSPRPFQRQLAPSEQGDRLWEQEGRRLHPPSLPTPPSHPHPWAALGRPALRNLAPALPTWGGTIICLATRAAYTPLAASSSVWVPCSTMRPCVSTWEGRGGAGAGGAAMGQ